MPVYGYGFLVPKMTFRTIYALISVQVLHSLLTESVSQWYLTRQQGVECRSESQVVHKIVKYHYYCYCYLLGLVGTRGTHMTIDIEDTS